MRKSESTIAADRRDEDIEAQTVELDNHSASALRNAAVETTNGPHPGTRMVFDDEISTATPRNRSVHELSASPVRSDNNIWQGPGTATIEPHHHEPTVASTNMVGASSGFANVTQAGTSQGSSCRHLLPDSIRHKSSSPLRSLQKDYTEPEFEMLTQFASSSFT